VGSGHEGREGLRREIDGREAPLRLDQVSEGLAYNREARRGFALQEESGCLLAELPEVGSVLH